MSKNVYDERRRKLYIIVGELEPRELMHEQIAQKYGMKVEEVRFISQQCNWTHTRHKTRENLREGEKLNMCISMDQLAFLDKYDF